MAELLDPLVPLRPAGSRVPLYCVHPISGSAYSYGGLVSLLDSEQPVFAFEAPGFDNERRPRTVLEDLSSEYVADLKRARPRGPYLLLGWSMGGVVAFDMACRLAALGAEVPALILIDAPAPERAPLPSVKDQLRKMLHDLVAAADMSPAGPAAVVELAPDNVCPMDVFEEIERRQLLPPEIDAEFLESRFVIFRAHLEALFNYAPSRRYHGPTTLIRAAESPAEYLDWGRAASQVSTHVVPGDHHSIWTGDRLTVLARVVQARLDEVTASDASSVR